MWFLLILILHLDSFFTRVTEQLRERLQWFNNTIEVCSICRSLCILYSLFLAFFPPPLTLSTYFGPPRSQSDFACLADLMLISSFLDLITLSPTENVAENAARISDKSPPLWCPSCYSFLVAHLPLGTGRTDVHHAL